VLAAGVSREEILADFPYLEEGDITAALEYAASRVTIPFCARIEPDAAIPCRCAAPAGAGALAERELTAEHVFDLGMASADDRDI
jgi:hypothetical protein